MSLQAGTLEPTSFMPRAGAQLPNHSLSFHPVDSCGFTASVKTENVLPLRSCLFLKKFSFQVSMKLAFVLSNCICGRIRIEKKGTQGEKEVIKASI